MPPPLDKPAFAPFATLSEADSLVARSRARWPPAKSDSGAWPSRRARDRRGRPRAASASSQSDAARAGHRRPHHSRWIRSAPRYRSSGRMGFAPPRNRPPAAPVTFDRRPSLWLLPGVGGWTRTAREMEPVPRPRARHDLPCDRARATSGRRRFARTQAAGVSRGTALPPRHPLRLHELAPRRCGWFAANRPVVDAQALETRSRLSGRQRLAPGHRSHRAQRVTVLRARRAVLSSLQSQSLPAPLDLCAPALNPGTPAPLATSRLPGDIGYCRSTRAASPAGAPPGPRAPAT